MKPRNVIVHYHLFKNAGTSVDHLLRKNFSDRWGAFDGESPGDIITTSELEKKIQDAPDQVAFSSHQIVPPLPQVDANVFPIVFLRDPIDRIKSAYLFEWKKQLGLETPKGTLKEYIETKFRFVRKSSVEEFQTIRLSNQESGCFQTRPSTDEDMVSNACEFLSSLEFVGIVDEFDRSMELLTGYLRKGFPDFQYSPVKANVLQDINLEQSRKRQRIHDELGDELFELIVDRNQLDERLYQHARSCMESLELAAKSAA